MLTIPCSYLSRLQRICLSQYLNLLFGIACSCLCFFSIVMTETKKKKIFFLKSVPSPYYDLKVDEIKKKTEKYRTKKKKRKKEKEKREEEKTSPLFSFFFFFFFFLNFFPLYSPISPHQNLPYAHACNIGKALKDSYHHLISMDSGLEAFSHNPTHDSFSALTFQSTDLPIM